MLDVENISAKPAVVISNGAVHSFISASYAFEHGEGKVGELSASQFAVISNAVPSAAAVVMAEIKIEFEGSMKPIMLKHQAQPQTQDGHVLQRVVLAETVHAGRPFLIGEADLTFPPGQVRVFELDFLPREAGDARATSASFSVSSDAFDLEYVHAFELASAPDLWWGEKAIRKRIVRATAASAINILPKPPKMKLKLSAIERQYYTNEQITIEVDITNDEEEDSIARLQVLLLGEGAPEISVKLLNSSELEVQDEDEEDIPLSGLLLGKIPVKGTSKVLIQIPQIPLPATYEISLKASYNLTSDLETPIYRSISHELEVTTPFEANYDFAPRVHPSLWPNFFTHDESSPSSDEKVATTAGGLSQRWSLLAHYFSFATTPLLVSSTTLVHLSSTGNIQNTIKPLTFIPKEGTTIDPKTIQDASFEISTQKHSLDDRGGATMDVGLVIKWRRPESPAATVGIQHKQIWNTTTLGVPRLLVSSTEPRVLTSLTYSTLSGSPLLNMTLHIENPSSHFLTFALSLEPPTPATYAFSGAQQTTVQLVPFSRRDVVYKIVPYVRGEWCGPVNVVVRDRYFMKVLRVVGDEGQGVRGRKEGLFLWVPEEEIQDEEEKASPVDEVEEGQESEGTGDDTEG